MAARPPGAAGPIPVLVAGGWGTRFWPLSTPARPKQLVPLEDGRTMVRATFARLGELADPAETLVLTGEEHADAIRAELPELGAGQVIGEPLSRDSAAAAALAVRVVRERWPGRTLAFLPTDHAIRPDGAFRAALRRAGEGAAASGAGYLFGVRPTRAATEYGYLEVEDAPGDDLGLVAFREKPDDETAAAFLAGGRHLWNSGIFVWDAAAAWEAIEWHMPEHARRLGAVPLDARGLPDLAALRDALEPLPKISFDYALLEKHDRLRCLKVGFEWSDLGGWAGMSRRLPEDAAGNRVRGAVTAEDAKGCWVYCEDAGEEVALLGVEDLVVVRSEGRTLVARRDRLGDLKALVTRRRTEGADGEAPAPEPPRTADGDATDS